MAEKLKRKNKADCGKDFKPPDGGWGWIICIASGITNIFLFPVFQFFGLIFREKFEQNGITNQQIAIMINSQMGVAALSGFFYGPIFRKFTFRKIAIFGSIQIISGIYFLSLAESFPVFLLIYVFYLAVGKELIIASKQMALNTYFLLKRRKAISIVSGLPSLINIGMPAFITFLVHVYSSTGTLLILCGFAGNVLVASMTYQPVKWHVKKEILTFENIELNRNQESPERLASNHIDNREDNTDETTKLNRLVDENFENQESSSTVTAKPINESVTSRDSTIKLEKQIQEQTTAENSSSQPTTRKYLNCCRKIVDFFDMDLINDTSFINICFGLACMMLVELNFKILTPFFLKDFGYSDTQIAFAMSIGLTPDLVMKFLIPYLLDWFKIKWTNRTLWIFCIIGMMAGQIVVAQNPSFPAIVFFMFVEGIFSGSKAIFNGMLIPDHVTLGKMPAAFGIERFIRGVFMLGMGPVIGGIRQRTNYTITLLFLCSIISLVVALWGIERCLKKFKKHTARNQ